jgi:hypothetical protein
LTASDSDFKKKLREEILREYDEVAAAWRKAADKAAARARHVHSMIDGKVIARKLYDESGGGG